MIKLDDETKKVLSESESIKVTMDSPGWKIIEKIFFDYLNAFDSISNYTSTNPDELVKEIVINKKVMETLKLFWQDISGSAESASDIKQAMSDEDDNNFMVYSE